MNENRQFLPVLSGIIVLLGGVWYSYRAHQFPLKPDQNFQNPRFKKIFYFYPLPLSLRWDKKSNGHSLTRSTRSTRQPQLSPQLSVSIRSTIRAAVDPRWDCRASDPCHGAGLPRAPRVGRADARVAVKGDAVKRLGTVRWVGKMGRSIEAVVEVV